MTRNDLLILNEINRNKATNSLTSVTVSTLSENVDLSHTKIRLAIKLLTENELVAEGYMQRNARTYYITQKGIDLINNLYKSVKTEEE